MVEWIGRALFFRGYVMVAPVRVEQIGHQPPPDAGAWSARYTYHGPCKGGRYVITNQAFYREQIGIIVTEDGTIPCETSVLQIGGRRCLRGREWRTPESVGKRLFAPAGPNPADAIGDAIRWELIYGGRSGEEMALTYREYVKKPVLVARDTGVQQVGYSYFARPDFYQDLKYDLSKSSRVVFREIELEILEASNAGVRFRVLRDAERLAPQPAR